MGKAQTHLLKLKDLLAFTPMLGKEEARSWIRNTPHCLGLGRYGSATRRSEEPSSACAPCAVPIPQQRRGRSWPGRCSCALLQHRARARHRHLQRSQRVTVSRGMSRKAAFCKLVQVSGWFFFSPALQPEVMLHQTSLWTVLVVKENSSCALSSLWAFQTHFGDRTLISSWHSGCIS